MRSLALVSTSQKDQLGFHFFQLVYVVVHNDDGLREITNEEEMIRE